jgi:hypothetical protein
MAIEPISGEVASALARFFTNPYGTPSHRELSEIFKHSELDVFDPTPDSTENIGKERRVRTVLSQTAEHPSPCSTRCVSGLLASLRACGCFDSKSENFAGPEVIRGARRAFENVGWEMDESGRLGPKVLDAIPSAQRRPVIELQIERIRNAPGDVALLIGTAKEMLESTCRYVLDELGQPVRSNADFNGLLYLARERLGILPQQASTPALREVLQNLSSLCEGINKLRGEQGTGHGSNTLPIVPPFAARAVVQSSAVMAQLLLGRLDAINGRT